MAAQLRQHVKIDILQKSQWDIRKGTAINFQHLRKHGSAVAANKSFTTSRSSAAFAQRCIAKIAKSFHGNDRFSTNLFMDSDVDMLVGMRREAVRLESGHNTSTAFIYSWAD